ncbi:CDP-alcohol phosphatidyltransferase family protein [Blattabacterium cuenoti]|uniref:CDP-alcohol phosphatidyltransferase family protein n=1 Tax=Blattabacterium cuenoti TaxID=1653831 RepID=UPI00163D100A|nr:CDP-alcohol phosphatidyltransferase family protein [Blattabacterium cuenoti]
MIKIKRTIPNIFTLLNLFFGCISITFLQEKNFVFSTIATIFSIIFDFLDGFFSRIIKKNGNEFGKELDSLADMVSFGIVPSLITFILLKKVIHQKIPFIEWFSFFISIFSACRLANFNIDKNKKNGLTTPINTLFFSFLSIITISNSTPIFIKNFITNPITILFMIFFSCYFLISKISMISLNFEGLSWIRNKKRYIFLLISMFLLLTLHLLALPCIIICYIIISLYFHLKKSY